MVNNNFLSLREVGFETLACRGNFCGNLIVGVGFGKLGDDAKGAFFMFQEFRLCLGFCFIVAFF